MDNIEPVVQILGMMLYLSQMSMKEFSDTQMNIISPFTVTSNNRQPIATMDNQPLVRWRRTYVELVNLQYSSWLVPRSEQNQDSGVNGFGCLAVTPSTFYSWHNQMSQRIQQGTGVTECINVFLPRVWPLATRLAHIRGQLQRWDDALIGNTVPPVDDPRYTLEHLRQLIIREKEKTKSASPFPSTIREVYMIDQVAH